MANRFRAILDDVAALRDDALSVLESVSETIDSLSKVSDKVLAINSRIAPLDDAIVSAQLRELQERHSTLLARGGLEHTQPVSEVWQALERVKHELAAMTPVPICQHDRLRRSFECPYCDSEREVIERHRACIAVIEREQAQWTK